MTDRAQFLAKLNAFLDQPRASVDTSWPTVTEEDMQELWGLVGDLIDLKFERDCDGDSVIDVILTDRSRYEKPLYLPIPWSSQRTGSDDDAPDLQKCVEAAQRHSCMAKHHQERSDQELRKLQMLMSGCAEKHTPVKLNGLEYRVPVPAGMTLQTVAAAAHEAVAERVAQEPFPDGYSESRAWAEKAAKLASEKAGVKVLARTSMKDERGLRFFMDVPSFSETIRVVYKA